MNVSMRWSWGNLLGCCGHARDVVSPDSGKSSPRTLASPSPVVLPNRDNAFSDFVEHLSKMNFDPSVTRLDKREENTLQHLYGLSAIRTENNDTIVLLNMGADLDKKGELGRGSYGRIRLGYSINHNRSVAVKKIRKDRFQDQALFPKIIQDFEQDYSFSKQLGRYVDISRTTDSKGNNTLYLMSTPARKDGFSIREEVINRHQALDLAKGFAYALKDCHSNNIIHNDVKLENLLKLNDTNYALVDFGSAVICEKAGDSISTDYKMSTRAIIDPQIKMNIELRSDVFEYSQASDIWALSSELLNIFFESKSFFKAHIEHPRLSEEDYSHLLEQALSSPSPWSTWGFTKDQLSALKMLITDGLAYERQNRPSAELVCLRLEGIQSIENSRGARRG